MPPDGDLAAHVVPEKPRASRASKPRYRPTLGVQPLPSIESLARHAQACSAGYDEVHALRGDDKRDIIARERSEAGINQIEGREDAISALIATMPARTLGDVVVQIGLIQTLLDAHDRDEGDDLSQFDADDVARIHADIRKVFRLASSIMPVVIAESGIAPSEVLSEWHLGLWDRRYGAATQVLGELA